MYSYNKIIFENAVHEIEKYSLTSRVPAVLLRGNSKNAYVYFQSLLPDYSILIVEYHRKIIIPKPNIFTKTRNQDSFPGFKP
jgi:hypothetical protein